MTDGRWSPPDSERTDARMDWGADDIALADHEVDFTRLGAPDALFAAPRRWADHRS